MRENVLLHIVQQIPVGAPKVRNRGGEILPLAQGKRRQLQTGDPPLGARRQGGYVFFRERQAHPLYEKAGRLLPGKAQILVADLDHLRANTKPGEGKLRIRARGEHQVHISRWMIEQRK